MKRRFYSITSVFILLFIIISILLSYHVINVMNHQESNVLTVAIDAGHGGFDPGKVGINNSLEKNINLSIAYKLKNYLEQNDISVLMTRKEDKGLYKESDRNRKLADMQKRVTIINSSKALIAISIHQNSFTQENVKGAQVFYYQNSVEGKKLAEILQESLNTSLDNGKDRVAKSNSSYYLLIHTDRPLVIVECGFLSNREEANRLCDDLYQEKIALAINMGVIEYIYEYNNKNKALQIVKE